MGLLPVRLGFGAVEMMISRRLANKVQNQLQLILSQVETGQTRRATKTIRELGTLIARHLESPAEERARIDREDKYDD
jgi:hypothetical protein